MNRLVAAAAATALLAATPAWAAAARADARLDEASVRAFVARQEQAWNSGALPAWFSAFDPKATFTDRYRTPAGQLIPYGTSTLAEARAQTAKFRATAKVSETARIRRIAIAPDGRTAQVLADVTAVIETGAGRRVTCAERRQDLVMSGGRLRSKGRTDTFMRCGR